MSNAGETDGLSGQEIAVVGMAGRFPGASGVEEFWRNLREGRDCISRFTDEELLAAGASPEDLRDPHYVRAAGTLEGIELFDAAFWGLAPREAAVMNPQHRLFLECAWEALENAGYDSAAFAGRIGSFSGAELNNYWMNLVSSTRVDGGLDVRLGNTTSNVATRVAYELNLEGPALNVQTACSSSLVAVHLAVQSLLAGESDLALAGGVSVAVPQGVGYHWSEGSPMSSTGECRSYDADARGAVPGSGVGVVVLRRLEDALADGDTIHAVIRGSTVNNDGSAKIGYTAPRKDGQAKAILEAIALAGVEPETITLVEGHGSATELGDPIEVEALTQAFRSGTDRRGFCALGSVKSNVGHLDSAAGVTGLIKTVLALEHGEIPPSLHFEKPNPKIDFARSPFFVNTELRPWTTDGVPRRAGVSSFGMGGTNAHLVLEEPPRAEPSGPSRPWQLVVLSARTPGALEAATDRLADHLRSNPEQDFADVAHTLRVGRRRFGQRRVLVCRGREDALAALEGRDPQRLLTAAEDWEGRGVVFLFPGLGDHYAQMARGLYESEPVFRKEVDRCAALLQAHTGTDVRRALFPGEPAAEQRADAAGEAAGKGSIDLRGMLGRTGDADLTDNPLARTEIAQPAVFVVEYALARTWMSWGVQPKAMIGHSLGEYVAATVAGVMSLDDALGLVAERARLIAELPAGAMLAVPLDPAAVQPLLRDGLALGAHNAPGLCTVSGPPEAVAALEADLVGRGVACRRLAASHAFHSPMMDPVAERLAERVRRTKLKAPKIPFASNVTGTWITAEEAADPEYWTRHLCRTVRFAEGMEEVLRDRSRVLLEVGPGRTLGTFALGAGAAETSVLASLRHAYTRQADQAFLLETLGRLWMAGVKTDWAGFAAGERRRRVPLPTYPWERQRYWIDRQKGGLLAAPERRAGPDRRVTTPAWRRAPAAPRPEEGRLAGTRWLLFVDGPGLGAELAQRLRAADAEVVTVEPGEGFERAGERAFRVRPAAADDYRALLAALRASGPVPRDVVHLWSVGPDGAYERGYASLLLLARALEHDGAEASRIHVVADRLHEVAGGEDTDPARATLLGPCATIPAEFPGIGCRVIDVRAGADAARLADHLLAEVASGGAGDAPVALRGWRRWTLGAQRVRPTPAGRSPFREGGAYLFAGRLGESALELAAHLARTAGARVVLALPADFPPRAEWEELLPFLRPDDAPVRIVRAALELEAAGAEVLPLAADWADPAAVAAALAGARERCGELRGAFYTQALEPFGGTDPAGADAHFRELAERLDALEAALDALPLDFCLVQTWIPAGGTERTGPLAAAHLAAAVARRHDAAHPTPWTAVAWDRWQPVEASWLVPADARRRAVTEWLAAVERVVAAPGEPEVRAGSRRRAGRAVAGAAAALPPGAEARHARPALANAYVAPRTETEARIAEVWQGMLEIGEVGVHDDFFALGGHSLYATQIISRVRDAFDVELSLQAIFEHPTVAGLAGTVEELRASGATALIPPIRRTDRSRPLPLSYQQERMWVLDQLEPGNPFYNVSAAQRFTGMLDVETADRALKEVVRRHEVLRTGYEVIDGQPMQVIHPDALPDLRIRDLRHVPAEEREAEALRVVEEEGSVPQDLTRPPLARMLLVRMADDDQILVSTFHHIAVDGWSGNIFFMEWRLIYSAFISGQPVPLPELPVQYGDYAVWQREYMSGERLAAQVAHWREHLASAPAVLELPSDRPRPPFRTYNGGYFKPYVSPQLKAKLEAIAQREGVTLFILMLSVYYAQLFRYTGQEDLIIGTVEANRQREETEPLVGFFINTLALRASLRGDPSFVELFRQVRDVALDAYANADLPLEKLLESLQLERDLSRNPLLQIMFGLERPALNLFTQQEGWETGLEGASWGGQGLVDTGTTKFDLTYLLKDNVDHVAGVLEYNSDLFDRATIVRLWQNYHHMLEQVAGDPGLRVSQIGAVAPEEQEQVRAWNDTALALPLDRPVHALFAERAALQPDSPAVQFGALTLSYAELDRRTRQLARHLRALGVGPETRVAVCLERSPEMLVALLGILRSGGAFVPLDPAHPADRLAGLLEDAAAPVLLTHEAAADRVPAHPGRTLLLDRDWPAVAAESDAPLDDAAAPDALAYVIFTSGSTGRPKGVRVSHGSLLNTTLSSRDVFGFRAGDVIPSLATYAFDIWLWEVLCPLTAGGTVRVIPRERITDMEALAAEVRDASLLHAVPALMRPLARAVIASGRPVRGLRRAFVGGDVVPADLWTEMREAFPDAELWVLYGPTEGTILCTAHRVDDPAAVARNLIGAPLANARVYVCDQPGRQVPVGVPGELYLGGAGVAQGYLDRPELTAEKFVQDPFSGDAGARLYRTGDRVRWLADGTLEFLGRTDTQVKVRGYRIEPGEVEAAMLRHPQVDDAVVLVREDEPGDRRLVGYLVPPRGGRAPEAGELRAFLREAIPEYMVPAAFVALDTWPLSSNGKIDRGALPAPERGGDDKGYVAPRSPVEETLARVWAETLRVPRVGVQDNFFELGGDSILSIQVVARAHRAGVTLKPRYFFEHPTIAELAPLAESTAAVEAEQGVVTGEAPLTPTQHWFFEQDLPEPGHWNMPLLLAARGPVDHAALEGAVRALAEHHDALRTRFSRGADGRWTQTLAGLEPGIPVERVDLSAVPADERSPAVARLAAEMQGTLELGGPLVRVAHFDLGPDAPGRVFLLAHHLVMDGASWRTVLEDLQTAYEQLRAGGEVVLPPKTTSFKAWAEKLVELVRSGALDAEAALWTDPARAGVAPLPTDSDGPNLESSEGTVTVALTAEETRALLQEAPAAYRTQINDLLLAAVARAFGRWTGDARVLVQMESHGREEHLVEGVDLSRTVGWLTAAYPLLLDLRGAEGEEAAIKAVKEQLRAVPERGIGYGLLRWLGGDEVRERLRALPQAQASFNYLGQIDGTFSDEGAFRMAEEPTGRFRSPLGERWFLLDLMALVEGGELILRMGYSTARHRRETVLGVLEDVAAELRALLAHCARPDAGGYTPSDFPLARLGQAELDELVGSGRGVEDVYPLTPMQEGMLFHSLFAPGGGAYVGQFMYDLVGPLDASAFGRAWSAVVRRHGILRTGFQWGGERPFQVVRREAELPLRAEDWRSLSAAEREARLEAFLAADREEGFDTARAPLMRVALFRTGDGRHRLVWTHHHLLLDGWSLPLVFRDVAILYDAFTSGREPALPPTRPYRDYIAWLQRQDAASAEEFWRGQLAGVEAATPFGIDRAAPRHEAGFARATTRLSPELSARLADLARGGGLTLSTLVQGAWALLLARYSGQADVVFGSTVSGRPAEVEGVEGMVGLFINTLPVRVPVPADAAVLPWLRGLQERQARLREYEFAPLAQVQRWSGVEAGPLFESIVVFENYPVEDAFEQVPEREFEVETVGGLEQTDYPLTLTAGTSGPDRVIGVTAAYGTGRFDADAVERMLGHFHAVLAAFADAPEGRLGDVSLLAPDEARRVAEEWSGSDAVPAEPLSHELVAAQAARTPDAPALRFRGETVAYAELDRRANRLAHHLRALGVGPETRVGVMLERTPELVVALLAVLKAGGAYLPLDPAYPAERLAFMLEDAGARVVVTEAQLAGRLPAEGVHPVAVDAERGAIAGRPDTAPESGVLPENLSHVIYTSGSTGRPKGVMVRHASVAARLHWLRDAVPAEDRAALLFSTSVSFDVSVAELFGALAWGGTLLLAESALELPAVAAAEPVRYAGMVPTAALELLRTGGIPASVNTLFLAGEPLHPDLARALYDLGHVERIANLYGPTEDTTFSTCSWVERGAERVLVGRPLPGTRARVLDAELRHVPVGVAGELYLAGAGLARGYLDRPELTAERFLPDPHGEPGSRMYRVMDRVRWAANGELEYLGRLDFQVKVRGFRVELGEIEAALRAHPGVRDAVAMVRPGPGGEPQLLAWTVAAGAEPAAAAELRQHLRDRLPDYMVPAAFVAVDSLPLTPSGKLDRRALPAPEGSGEPREYVAPRTPVEELLAEIVGEVLGLPQVGVHDDFFELGGHSLLATRVLSRVRRQLGVELALRTLFEAPTVAGLAELLAGHQPEVEEVEDWELAAELERLSELSEEEVMRLLRES
ncbi:MAG TPA: amino acid adenylation domain-containing protein [Longimicrobiaceae bacterium]|jgi:amino acid adenylation domain-containing protein/non-ribosomal peptide synthase protein (TIGR01720 family)